MVVCSNYLDLISKLIHENCLTKNFLVCLFIYDKTCKGSKIKLRLEDRKSTDGGVKLSETQIPTQEKTSFEIVYDAKAELRTWKLKTRDSRACFLQYTQTKLNGERFIPFPITSNYL